MPYSISRLLLLWLGQITHTGNASTSTPRPVYQTTPAPREGPFERFQKLRPPTFMGSHNPAEAEYWLNRMLKMVQQMECSESEQVNLVTFMLEKEADIWWKGVCKSVPDTYV